jgi:hypothetical protein
MFKKSIYSLFIIGAFAAGAFAQTLHTPEKGSAERSAILDALRVPVERELKQKVVFAAENFNVQGNWAFLSGQPQTPSGGQPNYKGTSYQNAIKAGMFDNNFFALLKRTGGKWKVIQYQIGCTDVCYLPWQKDYKAPKAIFPNMDGMGM